MRVVDLEGSPAEIGFGHGQALAGEIAVHLAAWRRHLGDRGIADPVAWGDEFVATSGFVADTIAAAPDLATEIEAIAEGAGIRSAEAWLLQLMDESWAALDGRPAGLGCSSFGLVEGARSWSGQTMDLETFRHGTQAVLRIRPDGGHEQLVLTMAGCIGLLGVNAAGLAVLVNALAQVPARSGGLPVAVITRQLIGLGDLTAAVELVTSVDHATGQHYLLVATDRVASFECSPAGVARVRPDAVRQWHTNHPLVGYLPEPDDAESERRWEAILPAMRHGGWGRGRSQLLLESPPVCRRGDGDDVFTFAAVTVEQSTDAIDVLVTDGPPQRAAWVSVGWTLPLPVKYLTTEQPARRL